MRSEPLIEKISADGETIDVIRKEFPSRIKDDRLAYMYGISVIQVDGLGYGIVKMDFNDGSHKLVRISIRN